MRLARRLYAAMVYVSASQYHHLSNSRTDTPRSWLGQKHASVCTDTPSSRRTATDDRLDKVHGSLMTF